MDGTDNTLARVEFDATLEEVVDEQIRFAGSTKTFARQRLIQVVSTGMGATVGLLAMWYGGETRCRQISSSARSPSA